MMHTMKANATLRRSRSRQLPDDSDLFNRDNPRSLFDGSKSIRRSFPTERSSLLPPLKRAASLESRRQSGRTGGNNGYETIRDSLGANDQDQGMSANDGNCDGEGLLLPASNSLSPQRIHAIHEKPSWHEDLTAIAHLLLDHKLNLLLFLAPLAVWASLTGWGDSWVFLLNFMVMVPLANLLGEATESLAFHTGETIGGLVNATFGNAVEVVVAVLALSKGEIAVVQSSLIGSVLSNLLLVLGCSFIAGGLVHKENSFNAVGASANSSLLILSSFAMLFPSYIYYFSDHESQEERVQKTLALSHVSAIVLLFMYLQLLFFQLHTHLHLFEDDNEDDGEVALSKRASGIVLFVSTLLVAFFSEFLVGSIDGFAEELQVSKSFIGIVLLPIVGNAVEHVTAVKVALHDKMELAMGVAVGSATQVSLFVVPIVVMAGWAMGQPMTLAFPQFEIMIYLMSILIVYAIIADGKSNWLEGSMLLTAYALVAIALFWVDIPTNQ